MKKFEFSSSDAKLKNLNIRTEGNEKQPTRAVDLKFEMVTAGDVLTVLCGGMEAPDFWHASGAVKHVGMDSINSRVELQGAAIKFGDLGMNAIELRSVKVNKFVFTPLDSQAARIVLRVQAHPTDAELIQLSSAIKTRAEFHMEAMLGYTGEGDGLNFEEEGEEEAQEEISFEP